MIKKLKRADVLRAMRAAGADNDSAAWIRLRCENRVSHEAGMREWRAGRRFAELIAARDAKAPPV